MNSRKANFFQLQLFFFNAGFAVDVLCNDTERSGVRDQRPGAEVRANEHARLTISGSQQSSCKRVD